MAEGRKKKQLKQITDDEEEENDTIDRKPLNEFHDAYCTYMLLKVKIKHKVYTKAHEMLEETEECIKKNDRLRTMVPDQARSFMVAETAFILNETLDAIS